MLGHTDNCDEILVACHGVDSSNALDACDRVCNLRDLIDLGVDHDDSGDHGGSYSMSVIDNLSALGAHYSVRDGFGSAGSAIE